MSEVKKYPHLQTILDFAEGVYQKEKEILSKSDTSRTFMPGDATTCGIPRLIEMEIRRREEISQKHEPCGVDKETLEQAIHPFCALALILRKSNAEDIDAGYMADVLGALVYSAWARTGYPRLGDVL